MCIFVTVYHKLLHYIKIIIVYTKCTLNDDLIDLGKDVCEKVIAH